MAEHGGEWIIQRFGPEDYGSNAYLLANGKEAALIDAAGAVEEMDQAIANLGVGIKYLLLTHGSESLAESTPLLKKRHGGKVCIHAVDHEGLGARGHPLEADLFLKDNDRLEIQGGPVGVLHTPGHTYGSLSFYVKNAGALFSGMSLLKGGYGRIWGPDSMRLMMMSLRRLNNVIPPEATVYPAEGPVTCIAKESWLNCLRSA